MASPVAHTLAGTIIYLVSRRAKNENYQELWWLILAANLPDFDLLLGLLMGDHSLFHRTFSHSIVGSLVFALIVYTVCWWREQRDPARITLLMFTAFLSQLFLDWLSYDPVGAVGIPVFWPFSETHYMADPTIFLNIERNEPLSISTIVHNFKAILLEIIILAPPAIFLWWKRKRGER